MLTSQSTPATSLIPGKTLKSLLQPPQSLLLTLIEVRQVKSAITSSRVEAL